MKNKEYKKNSGFTLIELIIVIAIIGILVAIAMPRFSGLFDNAKINADIATLRTLNNVSTMYAVSEPTNNEDIFYDINEDNERMQELVSSGYLGDTVEPQMKDETFSWDVDSQKWLYSYYKVATSGDGYYDFTIEDPNDYLKTSDQWVSDENGFYFVQGDGNGESRLFIDNKKDEYTITTTATLDSSNNNGYGIFFETSISGDDNVDNGYIVQFDRYFNSILLRKRNNGGEEREALYYISNEQNTSSDNLKNSSYTIDNTGTIPDSKNDEWWTDEHEITIDVKNSTESAAGYKDVAIIIDGVQVGETQTIESDIEPENNYTGFRQWSGATSYFKEMTIE